MEAPQFDLNWEWNKLVALLAISKRVAPRLVSMTSSSGGLFNRHSGHEAAGKKLDTILGCVPVPECVLILCPVYCTQNVY